MILGFEREAKDKSAGLKTISIITLGAALFAILSQNFSGEGDNFAIAAGIISGIGFLGAGVIFKEGFTIYGLTTAGIIWVAAAIGMAIGFGEIYIALTFLGATLILIYSIQYFGKYFMPKNNAKNLQIVIDKNNLHERADIIKAINPLVQYQYQTSMEKLPDGDIKIALDIQLNKEQLQALEQLLLTDERIITFSI